MNSLRSQMTMFRHVRIKRQYYSKRSRWLTSVKQALPENSKHLCRVSWTLDPATSIINEITWLRQSEPIVSDSATRSEITERPYELYEQWLRAGAVFELTTQLGEKEKHHSRTVGPWPVDIGRFRQREDSEESIASWLISYLDSYRSFCGSTKLQTVHTTLNNDAWCMKPRSFNSGISLAQLDKSRFGRTWVHILRKWGAALTRARLRRRWQFLLDSSTTHRMSCWLTKRYGALL